MLLKNPVLVKKSTNPIEIKSSDHEIMMKDCSQSENKKRINRDKIISHPI